MLSADNDQSSHPLETDSHILKEYKFEMLFDSSKKLKEEANLLLKTSYEKALQKYHESLEVLIVKRPKLVTYEEDFSLNWRYNFTESEKKQALEHFATIFSNCSYLYIEHKKPLMALYYAKFSFWSNNHFFKSQLRIAKALIDLLYLHEVECYLQKLKDQNEAAPFKAEINNMMSETTLLIAKLSSSGTVVQFLTNKLEWVEEKAYKGPIEIFETPKNGRGYCAKRNIMRGETLLIEKGFVYGDKKADFCYHLITKLDKREDLKVLYMNLFPCKKYPLTKELQESIQGKIREHTLKSLFNSYKEAHPVEWKNFTSEEIEELLHKAQYDSFKVNGKPALFPHLSLLNHSCDPNTSVWYVQDMVLVLARRNIEKGEEICVTYAPVADDRVQRQAKLSFYGFECECARCQEIGEWEKKVHQYNGVRCPECLNEIAVSKNKKFVCPKGCWTGEYSLYEKRDKELKETLPVVGDAIAKLKDILKSVEKQFSHYHNNRALVLYSLAKAHARNKDKLGFDKYMREIEKMIEFYPSLELRVILNNLLYEIVSNFEREPSKEEFQLLSYFGLSLEVVQNLWKEFMKSNDIKWFLPLEGTNPQGDV